MFKVFNRSFVTPVMHCKWPQLMHDAQREDYISFNNWYFTCEKFPKSLAREFLWMPRSAIPCHEATVLSIWSWLISKLCTGQTSSSFTFFAMRWRQWKSITKSITFAVSRSDYCQYLDAYGALLLMKCFRAISPLYWTFLRVLCSGWRSRSLLLVYMPITKEICWMLASHERS